MSIRKKKKEILRLRDAFENEALKFHDINFSIHYVTQQQPEEEIKFHENNHAIVLWQYQGTLGINTTLDELAKNVEESDLSWGLRGAELSAFGVLEGSSVKLFVKMAKRAGSIFNQKEIREIQLRIANNLTEKLHAGKSGVKPVTSVNSNVLSIWLNYLLYHLSLDNPERSHGTKIEPDPFTLSLLALERLIDEPDIKKSDRSTQKVSEIKFKVALSFPGEKRAFVSKVTDIIRSTLGKDTVFYDYDYQSQLARPDCDTLLQNIYRNNSSLIVVFLCSEYSDKEWCGLEWRAIKDIIKSKDYEKIMPVKFDDTMIEGLFSTDGYIDGTKYSPDEVAQFILERVTLTG